MSDDIDWGFFTDFEEDDKPFLNRLAWYFYKAQGCGAQGAIDFQASTHPNERHMFNLACIAKNFLEDYGFSSQRDYRKEVGDVN